MLTTGESKAVIPDPAPSKPRLRLASTPSHRMLLDGGWWARSTDPIAELPGLILALDNGSRPVTRLMLSTADWGSQPRRLAVAGRVVRLGWFTSLPVGLLTAIWRNGDRADLLVVPPDTNTAAAAAAMAVAADAANTTHTPDILAAVIDRAADVEAAETRWESEGGHL